MSIAFWPAIQQVAAGTLASPASIARDSQWTIIAVASYYDNGTDTEHAEVILPSGCEVGDVVEIHNDGSSADHNPQVLHPSGETFNNGASIVSGPKIFRKISATVWSFVG